MNKACIFAVISCVLLAAFARADEKHPKLEVAKQAFDKADAALNKTYQAVRAELDKAKADELRKRQRDWIEYRDFLAEHIFILGLGEDDDRKKSADYWEIMTTMTGD